MNEPDRAIDEFGYSAALEELDAILVELDADDIDVDLLADKVARASQLIELCRGRITAAGLQVTEIVSSLAPTAPGPDETAAPADNEASDG